MSGLLLLVVAIKAIVFLVLWGLGYLALVVMIGLPLRPLAVGGGALILAVLLPVSIKVNR